MDDKVQEALRAVRQWYWEEVRSVAEEARDEVKSGRLADAEALQEWLHETIDGHQFVIYIQQAQMVLLASDNQDAYAEDFGDDEGATKDGSINWSLLAFCAMERDVAEQLGSLGVDVNDPRPAEEEEADGGE